MSIIDDLAARVKDSRGASVTLSSAEAVELLGLAQGRPQPKTLEMAGTDEEVGAALESLKGGGYDYPPEGNAGIIKRDSPAVFQEGKRGDALMEEARKEREESFAEQGMTSEGKLPEDQPVNIMATSSTFGQPVSAASNMSAQPAVVRPAGQKADSSRTAAKKRAGVMDATSGKRSKAGSTKSASKSAKKGGKR